MARGRTLYLPVMIAAALGVLALSLVGAPAAMAQTASVEGESFTHPRGTAVVYDQMYSGGAALKFKKSKAVATKQVTITETSNVLVRARAGQIEGRFPYSLTIRADGEDSGTLRITSSALADYNYPAVTLQPGTYTIGLKGGNIAQGRNVFVDVVSFPAIEQPPLPPPDPGKIFFTGNEDSYYYAYSMNPDGSNKQKLPLSATTPHGHLMPKLSPDGTRIAFVDRWTGNLYTADLDGGNRQAVIYQVGAAVGPYSWSPDGDEIVFQMYYPITGGDTALYIANANSTNDYHLLGETAGPFGSESSPNWSSTNKILFGNNQYGIYTVNPDGSGLTELVPNALGADWSPDGSKIVYQAVRNNERGLYISNADGSNEQLLRAGGISEAPT